MSLIDLDLLAATNRIQEIKKSLNNLRLNATLFNSLLSEVDTFINENKAFVFSKLETKRIRKIKQMGDEKSRVEPIIDPIEKFHVDTCIGSLDTTMSCIKEYFNSNVIHIYKDLALLTKI